MAKAELEMQEQEDGNITAIKEIPWLGKQYDIYYEALRNGVVQNNIRNLIMSLQP